DRPPPPPGDECPALAFGGYADSAGSLDEIVSTSVRMISPNLSILTSPSCASCRVAQVDRAKNARLHSGGAAPRRTGAALRLGSRARRYLREIAVRDVPLLDEPWRSGT